MLPRNLISIYQCQIKRALQLEQFSLEQSAPPSHTTMLPLFTSEEAGVVTKFGVRMGGCSNPCGATDCSPPLLDKKFGNFLANFGYF